MQKIGAYLLERRDGMFDASARNAEAAALRTEVRKWLEGKGAPEGATSGQYRAEDGSDATFATESAEDSGNSWSMARLEEVARNGRRFVAGVSVTTTRDAVIVYASLEVGSVASEINPVTVDARCPRIVRILLDLPGQWYHRASRLRPLRQVAGFDNGEELARELLSAERTLPWLVVTEFQRQTVLPGLDGALAYDLAGLANVVRLNEEAAWGLTDSLGRPFSCYSGAIRIYWPHLSASDDPFRHPLWTAQRLQGAGENPDETLTRFRSQLRNRFMRASALSVVRPREIDAIRANVARRSLDDLKASAGSLAEYKELADSYAADNDKLRAANGKLTERVAELAATLEETRTALLARIENAELQLRYREKDDQAIQPESEAPADKDEVGPPVCGDVRFYKKSHAAPTHDIMLRVGDCGCNNWQGGHAGDKAKKGIAKLEGGRTDWSKLQHCGSCTGGGLWRVAW
jgi:hypothetical protein